MSLLHLLMYGLEKRLRRDNYPKDTYRIINNNFNYGLTNLKGIITSVHDTNNQNGASNDTTVVTTDMVSRKVYVVDSVLEYVSVSEELRANVLCDIVMVGKKSLAFGTLSAYSILYGAKIYLFNNITFGIPLFVLGAIGVYRTCQNIKQIIGECHNWVNNIKKVCDFRNDKYLVDKSLHDIYMENNNDNNKLSVEEKLYILNREIQNYITNFKSALMFFEIATLMPYSYQTVFTYFTKRINEWGNEGGNKGGNGDNVLVDVSGVDDVINYHRGICPGKYLSGSMNMKFGVTRGVTRGDTGGVAEGDSVCLCKDKIVVIFEKISKDVTNYISVYNAQNDGIPNNDIPNNGISNSIPNNGIPNSIPNNNIQNDTQLHDP